MAFGLNVTRGALAKAMGTVSPRHRRWKRLLNELALDPDRLSTPLDPPGDRNFIICGCPRSGTTLLSAALYQPPTILTVMEPWDGLRVAPARLFASIRKELAATGTLKRGKLDLTALIEEGTVRWSREGSSPQRLALGPDYLLGVKWPTFWRYLDLLGETKFLVCIRHPMEVITSFRNEGGRLGLGLEYDVAFNRRMNAELEAATTDLALRRLLLFDYIHSRLLPYLDRPNVFVVRYERWFTERELLVSELSTFLGTALEPGPALIRTPRSRTAEAALPEEEVELIRSQCSTAEALGYRLTDRMGSAG